jgi:hypothetical protein
MGRSRPARRSGERAVRAVYSRGCAPFARSLSPALSALPSVVRLLPVRDRRRSSSTSSSSLRCPRSRAERLRDLCRRLRGPPAGRALFGHYTGRLGLNHAGLVLVIMGIATALIGFLPGRARCLGAGAACLAFRAGHWRRRGMGWGGAHGGGALAGEARAARELAADGRSHELLLPGSSLWYQPIVGGGVSLLGLAVLSRQHPADRGRALHRLRLLRRPPLPRFELAEPRPPPCSK